MHNKTKLLIFASLLLAACSTDPMQEIPNRGDSAPEIETSDKSAIRRTTPWPVRSS